MKNAITIIAECYNTLPTLPGYFKSFEALCENVNNNLRLNGIKSMTNEEIRSTILTEWPKAKFEDAYEHNGITMRAVRIVITKKVVLSDEEKERLRIAITDALTTKCRPENGWYDTVLIAPLIKDGGIDYKNLGFAKFSEMLTAVFEDMWPTSSGVKCGMPIPARCTAW